MAPCKKALLYGDSNTYGFDPEGGHAGGRYPPESRWPDILAAALAGTWEVAVDALPGRCLPRLDFEWADFSAAMAQNGRLALFAVMLGTNDYLSASRPDPERVGNVLEAFLSRTMTGPLAGVRTLVIAPPYLDFGADRYYGRFSTVSGELSRVMERRAVRQGADFLDAGALPLASDGIHLLPEGHRLLADKVLAYMRRLGI